jgi:hypothetical protein
LKPKGGIMGRRVRRLAAASHLCGVALIATLAIAVPTRSASAQVLPITAGAVGGFLTGTLVTTGIVVFQARMGEYIYGLDELITLRPAVMPIVLGPVAGIALGAASPETLKRAGRGALVGVVGGAAVGSVAGHLIYGSSDGRWAGGIIGAATGALAGSILFAALKPSRNADGAPAVSASFSVQFPRGDE